MPTRPLVQRAGKCCQQFRSESRDRLRASGVWCLHPGRVDAFIAAPALKDAGVIYMKNVIVSEEFSMKNLEWGSRLMPAGVFSVALGLVMATGQAASSPGPLFDVSSPISMSLLPAGPLKTSLEALPQDAQNRALEWMGRLSLNQGDLDYLRVDARGGVYFADTYLPDAKALTVQQTNEAAVLPAINAADTFLLHSRPGAPNVVYLDFDGHTITGTGWNSTTDPLVAEPYDIDGNPGNFSSEELARIGEIWHRVAEDLAPFDIDVTTEEPASFGSKVGRVVVTKDVDANGADMPAKGAGGVAYVDVFGQSYYPTYSPALVYFNNLGGGEATYVAEAASHEFGHNLGLSHDGTASGDAYYGGHGSGYVSWAPIMGAGYYNNVTQWSKGEYPDANQTQDDIAIIVGKLGYRPDDHGDSMGTATPLSVDAAGNIMASNPETDPHNTQPGNKGIITDRNDVDVFFLDAAAGPLSLTVTPAWDAFPRSSRRGANLDVEAVLMDSNGSVVASSDPVDDTLASISVDVSGGRYYLQIDGVGNGTSPGYSDYGSIGEYFINGNVTVSTTTFIDVPASYWAYNQIETLYQQGITSGCDTGLYCPEGLVTRAQMAVFLERAINGSSYQAPAASGSVFADVPSSYWAADWIEQLAADGITGGCGDGNYCPEGEVTRAEMAVFLLRAKHGSSYVPPTASGTLFGDVSGSYWAASWVEELANEGISNGCGGGNFCPDDQVTRAQMAVFMVNTFGW